LLSKFVLEYPIIRVKVNQDALKLNGTFRLIICADGVTILGGCVDTIKKKTVTLTVASTESGLEVNGHKIKYMVMFRD